MTLSDRQSLPVPFAEAWAALYDLGLLQDALPGCESLEETGAGAFVAVLAVPVGPLTARVDARLRRRDAAAPARGRASRGFTLLFDADAVGARAQGAVEVCLRAAGRSATTLHYALEVEVAGAVAQLGAPFIDAVAGRLAQQFFARLRDGLVARRAAA